ncbi:MAG: hypothetical protein M3547_00130 [Acidobacteriota bacterium]|nr:hypothetical protein [Acidobacteriota bacterium]
MPAVTDPLDDLPESPESLIAKSFFKVLEDDTILSAIFKDYRLVELPDPASMPTFGTGTVVVAVKFNSIEDWPSGRQTVRVDLLIGFYIQWEPTDEKAKCHGLRLVNRVRLLAWENQELKNTVAGTALAAVGKVITFATVKVRPLDLMATESKGTWIVRCQVTWETDIRPKTGDFEP